MSNLSKTDICAHCQGLLLRPEESLEVGGSLFSSSSQIEIRTQDVRTAALNGCPICSLCWRYLQACSPDWHLSDERPLTLVLELNTFHRGYDNVVRSLMPGNIKDGFLHFYWQGRRFENPLSIALRRRNERKNDPHICQDSSISCILCHAPNSESPASIPITTTRLAHSTGDQTRLATIKLLLASCVCKHIQTCHQDQQLKTGMLPRRLIDVSIRDKPRLVLEEEFPSGDVRYATLSHRWGVESMPRLLQANMTTLRRIIHPETLPRVFIEAMDLCQYLGIRYLWIDALCLIQDDEVDCTAEIKRMGDIYRHAFCNFSALAAARQSVGLYTEADPDISLAFPLTVQRGEQRVAFYGYLRRSITQLNDEDLLRRGWVFQERLLSARTIHFGDQISWECADLLANELFPGGVPDDLVVKPRSGLIDPFKVVCLLGCGHLLEAASDDITAAQKRAIAYDRWFDMVGTYSARELTFEDDIFPAISGLARDFNKVSKDRYLAGLWQGKLLDGLLWGICSTPSTYTLQSTSYRPKRYRGEPPFHTSFHVKHR